MKKLLLVFAVLAMAITTVSAQKKSNLTTFEKGKNTIGLRIGNGVEFSYQKYLRESNRVEVDLGYNFKYGFDLGATYQWLWGLDIEGIGFNWYAGAGANLGVWDKSFGLGVHGQVGIEYNFDIPLALSLDWRPSLHLVPGVGFGWEGFGLGVRYRF